MKHRDLGRVTEAKWILVHLTRDGALQNFERTSLMTAPTFHCPLQITLDNTEPGGRQEPLNAGVWDRIMWRAS